MSRSWPLRRLGLTCYATVIGACLTGTVSTPALADPADPAGAGVGSAPDPTNGSADVSATAPEPVQALASATSNTTRNADGIYTLTQSQAPINDHCADGTWAPIDTTLVDAPGDTYAAQNAAGDYAAKIPTDPATTPVRFAHDSARVTMRLHGAIDLQLRGAHAGVVHAVVDDGSERI